MATRVNLTPGGSRVRAYLEGGPELEAALQDLERGLADDILAEATLAGAEEIAEEWRSRVPVDEGHYRDSIKASSRRGRHGATAIVAPGRVPAVPRDQQPMTYAAKLEFGHSGRSRATSGRGSGYQAAQPSARPAFDAAQGRAVEAVEAKLRELVNRSTP